MNEFNFEFTGNMMQMPRVIFFLNAKPKQFSKTLAYQEKNEYNFDYSKIPIQTTITN